MRTVDSGWRFDRFTFEPDERRLRVGAEDVPAGARALDVLRVLVERAGRLVSKADLLERAWPGLVVEENNLQVQVSTLRRLLGPGAIVTVPGRGYRFGWPVEPLDGATVVDTPMPRPATPASSGRPVLPAPLTPLIGRDVDRAKLLVACGTHRLVTVVGSGGIGKTRVALDVARELAASDRFARVAFCDLTPVVRAPLVAAALATSVGAAPAEADAEASFAAELARVPTLLVVDNAEHVRETVADALAHALERAPAACALVTSQVPLDVPGERLHRLEPLSVPAADADLDGARASGAVAMFVAAAQAADPRFVLDGTHLAAVVEICRRLDGIPLALQLAAARVPQFGVAGVAQRLDQRFRLLARPSTAVPVRQQALAHALDWSHALLDDDERRVFRRLGVFAGEFALDEAIELAHDDSIDGWRATDAMGRLVDRSLVAADDGDPPRYRLLESVRLYALDRLVEAAETRVIDRAIARFQSAGEAASAASSHDAAARAFAAALELCARLPDGAARDARELALQLALGPAVQASSSPGCPRCEAVYGRAVELARGGVDGPARFQALWGYWQFLSMAGREREAAPLADELGALASQLDDDGYRLEARHASFSTSQLLGDARATLEHATAAIELYDPGRHHALTHRFGGHDPGVCALGQGAVARWLTGDETGARVLATDAERMGARFGHAYTQAVGHYYAAMTYAAGGDAEALARSAGALVAVSSRYGMAVLLTEGRLFAGRAAFLRGERANGERAMAAAYDEICAGGDFGFVPFYATLLADARLALGDLDGAERVLAQAEAIAQAGQGFFLPEVQRLAGEAASARGRLDEARARFEAAMSLARRQQASALEARAMASLERLTGPR